MLLKLPSGLKIAIPPLFPWESLKAQVLRIRSSRAFHPDHVTTRLTLALLDNLLSNRACQSLLDVGCGCGIFALAAARLGVPFVVGLDISAAAVKSSAENARNNGFEHCPLWFIGTLGAVKHQFDCITANLPYHVIRQIKEDLPRVLKRGGHLILSGFHDIHWNHLYNELTSLGYSLQSFRAGDRSFYGIPPSGSFTWMAADLVLNGAEAGQTEEGK